ncbi:MAG TPA: FHA domain-containing protein [Anaeromyxobacteraceae bacterium]|nr:FHA domain-containing protein [Anaeromyxobacteraceae bacterium]
MSGQECPFALRFVSGRYQGAVFPLREGREVIVGRSSEVDLVLAEDLVSRRHARFAVADGAVTLQDLGSTNGTFLNGQRVKKARLAEGDRILIGGSLLKLVAVDAETGGRSDAQVREELAEAARRASATDASAIRGRIDEVPLPDVAQLLGSARKTGVLRLRQEESRAEVHFREGRVVACALEGRPELAPRKAFARVLAWSDGTFELAPPAEAPPGSGLDEGVEPLLLQGLRDLDELRALGEAALHPTLRLTRPAPLKAPLTGLMPEDLDLWQLCLECGTVGEVLDRALLSDARVQGRLRSLADRGYLSLG